MGTDAKLCSAGPGNKNRFIVLLLVAFFTINACTAFAPDCETRTEKYELTTVHCADVSPVENDEPEADE
jgi:hypothetical protein